MKDIKNFIFESINTIRIDIDLMDSDTDIYTKHTCKMKLKELFHIIANDLCEDEYSKIEIPFGRAGRDSNKSLDNFKWNDELSKEDYKIYCRYIHNINSKDDNNNYYNSWNKNWDNQINIDVYEYYVTKNMTPSASSSHNKKYYTIVFEIANKKYFINVTSMKYAFSELKNKLK